MQEKTLQLDGVYKSFAVGRQHITVLHDISYTFKPGTMYAVSGASGSGKSTLLHMLGGFLQPDQGEIRYAGTSLPVRGQSYLQHDMGIMLQQPHLLSDLTVLENIGIKDILYGTFDNQAQDHAMQLCRQVGLHEYIHSPVNALSGGQQQRIALLRALYKKPALLLIDEPTANIDPKNKHEVLRLIVQYHTLYNCGVIIVTHDPEVYAYVDTTLHIVDGGLREIY